MCSSDFTRMPKGYLSMHLFAYSQFMTETESAKPECPLITKCSGLVLRLSKVVDLEGEVLTYRLAEQDLKQRVEFATNFFDDRIKV